MPESFQSLFECMFTIRCQTIRKLTEFAVVSFLKIQSTSVSATSAANIESHTVTAEFKFYPAAVVRNNKIEKSRKKIAVTN